MSQRLIICRGIPASGKSTFAKAWVHAADRRVRVNRDDIRIQMFGKFFGVNEALVTKVEDRMVDVALKSGFSVVADATNIKHEYCKRLAHLAHARGIPVEVKQFDIELDEALRRNAVRHEKGGNFVPEDVIRKMHEALQASGAPDISAETPVHFNPRPGALKAILVDIDGTIAEMGDRSPYDWNNVGKDEPIREVLKVVQWAAEAGYQVILMSGRDGVCRPQTAKWLDLNGIWFDRLFMRAEGDQRRDSIVKRELFDAHIRDEYDILFVLDDRQQVVDMWRGLGLRCLQVAPGDF
jgi:predicted kinase